MDWHAGPFMAVCGPPTLHLVPLPLPPSTSHPRTLTTPWASSAWTLSGAPPASSPAQGGSASPLRHVGTLLPALGVGGQRAEGGGRRGPQPQPLWAALTWEPSLRVMPASVPRPTLFPESCPLSRLDPHTGVERTCVPASEVLTPTPGCRQATQTAGASVATPVKWAASLTQQGFCEDWGKRGPGS